MNTVDYLAFPAILTNHRKNTTLKKKWDRDHYQSHLSRVRTAKSEKVSEPPCIPLHNYAEMKRNQMEHERLSVIKKSNQLLVEKISHIMRRQDAVDSWNTSYLQRRGFKKASQTDHKKWEDEWKGRRIR
ncbi:sperm axonemal maintenance protein CFAP97D1 [Mixophyes fleayi]|uniref:sperm axonemal maintenance protein CFAP97D1 n=1 Tax=Mixophyes fleayi TaxID=3061075 RepID=UPI003F4D9A84